MENTIYIERINLSHEPGERQPGIVDFVLGSADAHDEMWSAGDTYRVYGDFLNKAFQKRNVFVGKHFGNVGISVDELFEFNTIPNNVVFEICPFAYLSLSQNDRERLKDFNVYCHDYLQGGWHLSQMDIDIPSIHGSLDGVPWWIAFVVSRSITTGNFMNEFPDFSNKKKCIFPCHKPRKTRLDMLWKMHQRDVLKDCDWSCFFDFDEEFDGQFQHMYNVQPRNWENLKDHPFLKQYKTQIPKVIDHIESFTDCVPLNIKHHGKYKWHIVGETYADHFFASEKPWKAFVAGHPTLIIAKPGQVSLMKDLGFDLPGEYDNLYGEHRYEYLCDMLETDCLDSAYHNYKLVTNFEWTSEMLAEKQLNAIYNSIDRIK